ncbi:hypothetical protein ACJZ2D_010233 [Fusarium nematophilum]
MEEHMAASGSQEPGAQVHQEETATSTTMHDEFAVDPGGPRPGFQEIFKSTSPPRVSLNIIKEQESLSDDSHDQDPSPQESDCEILRMFRARARRQGPRRRAHHPTLAETKNEDVCVACECEKDKAKPRNTKKKWGIEKKSIEKPLNLSRCPCGHSYCEQCLARLLKAVMVDEYLFPPRCCGKIIPIDSLEHPLPPKLVGRFKAKKREYETPDRTYCHDPECSAFVPPRSISDDVAYCNRCNERTCALCKEAEHEGACPKDPATEEVLEMAEREG